MLAQLAASFEDEEDNVWNQMLELLSRDARKPTLQEEDVCKVIVVPICVGRPLCVQKLRCEPEEGWSGEITYTVCVFLETEHCVLFLSQKEMVGDDGFSVGREDGVRFSTPTSIWSRGQNSQRRWWVTLDIVLQN